MEGEIIRISAAAAYRSLSLEVVYFGGISEAYERHLPIVDHDILEIHVVKGVASLMDLLYYGEELAANMQNGVQTVPISVLLKIFEQSKLIEWHNVVSHQLAVFLNLINVV